MRMYTRKDVVDWLNDWRFIMTHYIVAHTRIHAAGTKVRGRERIKTQTQNNLRYTMNRVTRDIVGNNICKRNPHTLAPAIIATIEGNRESILESKTVHVNMLIGNLPPNKRDPMKLLETFKYNWHLKCGQSDDVWIEQFDLSKKLNFYITKEDLKPGHLSDCPLYESMRLPSTPLYVD